MITKFIFIKSADKAERMDPDFSGDELFLTALNVQMELDFLSSTQLTERTPLPLINESMIATNFADILYSFPDLSDLPELNEDDSLEINPSLTDHSRSVFQRLQ